MNDLKHFEYKPKSILVQIAEVLAMTTVIACVTLGVYVYMREVAGPAIDSQDSTQSAMESPLAKEMKGRIEHGK